VLIALLNNYVEPGMGATLSYKGLAIIVLGGLGNVRGTLIASLLLGVVENLGSIYLTTVLDRDAIGLSLPHHRADDPAARSGARVNEYLVSLFTVEAAGCPASACTSAKPVLSAGEPGIAFPRW